MICSLLPEQITIVLKNSEDFNVLMLKKYTLFSSLCTYFVFIVRLIIFKSWEWSRVIRYINIASQHVFLKCLKVWHHGPQRFSPTAETNRSNQISEFACRREIYSLEFARISFRVAITLCHFSQYILIRLVLSSILGFSNQETYYVLGSCLVNKVSLCISSAYWYQLKRGLTTISGKNVYI